MFIKSLIQAITFKIFMNLRQEKNVFDYEDNGTKTLTKKNTKRYNKKLEKLS